MARPKKNRDVNIVHFSFFDLLFGAFGAFVFLMIMQVVSTINLVDVDFRQIFDETVREKAALAAQLERYQQTDSELRAAKQELDELLSEHQAVTAEKDRVALQNQKLSEQLRGLEQFKRDAMEKVNLLDSLEEERNSLRRSLDEARERLVEQKVLPLEIKTTSLPTTITEHEVNIALAAVGGSPPYTWSVQGDLPTGIALNRVSGTLAGVPTSRGDYRLKLTVADARGNTAESGREIVFSILRKYEEPKSQVPTVFALIVAFSLVFIGYDQWQKHKAKRYIAEMEAQGYRMMWGR